ncbi:hypothetical protein CPB83DRAFT_695123 [Crepidotus variabilis]|uniref:Uncharacterized protein n=1 Tax=Crepidotus variabilis TaxID=179855 RepID=A0A9P6JJJ9_9AGAR|nr:hypothetical protein CPB83DRAFT_695123 [Crepidotus variabilis]
MHLNDVLDFRSQSWRIVDLLIPPLPSEASENEAGQANSSDLFQPWLSALRECCRTTLRKLTFVGATSSYDASGALFLGDDKVLDTHAVVSSLASSGLPLPRSPSGNLPDLYSDGQLLKAGDEREERGWWSLRYQQVFREFQRRDSIMFDDDE